jgi:LacI family gluconate utilization system Gnt-I transcriptional repressor
MDDKVDAKRSRRGSGAVTLREVAALAGVAPITASRALKHPQQVSPEVRERIAAAVQLTGYVPNLMAGSLASSRNRLIAAIVPTVASSVFLPTIEALNEALFDAGYQMMLGHTGYSPEREEALLASIIGRRPDGIVLTGILHSERGRAQLLASGIPVVETWDLTPTPIDMLVGFSHVAIGESVCGYLAGKGHGRLGLVTADDERARRRADAFAEAAQQRGLPAVAVVDVGSVRTFRSGREALRRLLAEAPGTDAVFCSSDLLALGAMAEALARGIPVPGQLAIVGCGDVDQAADVEPSLTSVRLNGVAIGEHAARFLIARAEGRRVEQTSIDVGFSIVERASA